MNKKQISEFLTSTTIEQQENLSKEMLDNFFVPNFDIQMIDEAIRPKESFLDLMKWVELSFKNSLKDKVNLNRFVHNRVIIDGQFITFAKEKGVKITCLYKDSIISWKTDFNFEKYFVQGVFKIEYKGCEFLHAALFHKGNQHEDEVSFFVICSSKNYQAYIDLRNSFDDWVQQRDRGNLNIRVIDGEDIPYTKDYGWNDLFLPDDIKTEIKSIVENFLSSQDFYLKNKIPWKRGILLYGQPGCHAIGTPIMMNDGSWKNVEDISVGDFLMGPDSKPREVLKLIRGNEELFKITPNKGNSFVVNGDHILHLHYSSKQNNLPQKVNMSVNDYLSVSTPLKQKLKLVKSSQLEFNNNSNLELDPYILGLWLGDGTTGKPEFTSADPEIINAIKEYAEKNNLIFKTRKSKSKALTVIVKSQDGGVNTFTSALRSLGIFDKKAIPEKYLTASVSDRLALLAGIIDTDGSYNLLSWRPAEKYNKTGNKGCFDLIQKDYDMSEKIGKIVLSLGLGFTIKPCVKTIKSVNFTGNYFRMSIYGDIFNIPTKLPRKQALLGKPNKDPKNIGIRSVESVGKGDYYGFIVDKDHLYVMDNFWITHNCGKTSLIRTLISVYNFKPITIVANANDETIKEAFSYAETQSPSLLYFEDLDSLFEKVDLSSFLNLMDGIASKNGLFVVATANEIKKLKKSITDRPSRFDRKYEIPLPNQKMAYIYLKKWFGNLLTDAKYKELSKISEKCGFSYVYLKELYISSMYEAISNNRKAPSKVDVDKALSALIKDKNILNMNKTVDTSKYL